MGRAEINKVAKLIATDTEIYTWGDWGIIPKGIKKSFIKLAKQIDKIYGRA